MKKLKVLLYPLSAIAVCYLVVMTYVGINVYKDNRKKSDAIIVLGAKSYKGKSYNPCLKARVDHAVDLYRQGYAGKLIMSGGNDTEDNSNEAETMKKIAVEEGIKNTDIVLENKSSSTYENIKFSKEIMVANELESAIVVTEPFHSPRAALISRKASLDYSVSPTLTSECWNRWKFGSRFFLREPLAIISYFIQGKL